jgi:hypothetical protein
MLSPDDVKSIESVRTFLEHAEKGDRLTVPQIDAITRVFRLAESVMSKETTADQFAAMWKERRSAIDANVKGRSE